MRNTQLYLKAIILGASLGTLISCCAISLGAGRMAPIYPGIDAELDKYYQEYFQLAKDQGITFKGKVTSGFKELNDGNTIGVCWTNPAFREIDIDKTWWSYSSKISRQTLIRHELTHCYCGRSHDFADGKEYQKQDESAPFTFADHFRIPFLNKKIDKDGDKEGFFEDGCPLTIMHPIILEDTCILSHYDHYIKEMFERCEAY